MLQTRKRRSEREASEKIYLMPKLIEYEPVCIVIIRVIVHVTVPR